jgi:beta-lactamase superfamily II metal-dependent hydrolase
MKRPRRPTARRGRRDLPRIRLHSPRVCERFGPGRFASPLRSLPTLALAALLLLALWLSGCGESVTEPKQLPLASVLTGIDGRQVLWTTDRPTRGAVRYGMVSGDYDRLAYPTAAGDRDKEYRSQHAVPLLSIPAGAPVYIQRTDRTSDGTIYAAAEETLRFETPPALPPLLEMATLDVQFGDSHVLTMPGDSVHVLIDGGDPGEGRLGETAPAHVRRWLQEHGVQRLDWVTATHMHADHYGGLVRSAGPGGSRQGLLELFPVGCFLDVPAVSGNEGAHEDLLALLAEKGITRRVIEAGMSDDSAPEALGWSPLVSIFVLSAGSQDAWSSLSYDWDRLNNDSIVLRIGYGDVDIMTGGDAETIAQAWIMARYPDSLAGIEYYKAQHHGREDGNGAPWVAAIAPRVSVIPVAFSAYNEGPDAGREATTATLQKLAAVGSDVFRFDDAEPVGEPAAAGRFWHTVLVTDGQSFEVHVEPSVWGE